jgi:serine/threonine-protein kinase RsbW
MSSFEANRLVLRNDLAELNRLPVWIEAWVQADLPADISFAIQLCLEEAVANIIMHGSPKDNQGEIVIEVERNGGTLVASIEDTGREFDPSQAPSPLLASSLEEAKVGHFGIHLMRSFAGGMNYERRDGRNRLTLRFEEVQTSTATGHDVDDLRLSQGLIPTATSRGSGSYSAGSPGRCRPASCCSRARSIE